MPESDVTTGELFRAYRELKMDINRQFDRLNQQMASLQFVHKDQYVSDMGALQRDIEELKAGRIKWPQLIATTLVSPLIVGIILLLLQLR